MLKWTLENRRGEVTSATVAGQSATYDYDFIGNFTSATVDGATTTYGANELNQYETVAEPDATLEPTYTPNGDLSAFGPWTYTYDALSRLTEVRSNGVLVESNSYDHQGRRVRLVTQTVAHTFIYDGWRPLVETVVRPDSTTDRIDYVWGKDISGSLDGAAGIGGLLYVKLNGEVYVPFYDAYGNVMGYRDAEGDMVAEYVYDAFGRTAAQNGTMADVFTIRYSTKYYDAEAGLYYYGKRYYSPDWRRWLTRDPIEERGGVNLYGFCKNDSISRVDVNGCGTWRFGIPSIFGNYPEFTVSYEMDSAERKCCKGIQVLRYVRKFITGGKYGPYSLDGTPDQFTSSYPIGYAPDDWPEGPGVGIPFADEPYYRITWRWDFLFKAKCTAGPKAGEILSTRQKFYTAAGHKQGSEDFKHGFY